MKRRVTMFRKEKTFAVPGVALAGQPIVYVGMECPVPMNGGGYVGEMELVANGTAILIRKVDAKGASLRNFGTLSNDKGKTARFEGDWTIFPLSKTLGCVGEDVPEQPTAKHGEKCLEPGKDVIVDGLKSVDPTIAKPIAAQPKGK